MKNFESARSRVIPGFFVLVVMCGMAVGQDSKSDPQTPGDRILAKIAAGTREHTESPLPRLLVFDVVFPASVEEAAAVKGHAVLLVNLITHEGKERPFLRAYVVSEGKPTELVKAGSTGDQADGKNDTTKAFGKYWEKTFYLLPINLANAKSELFVELQNGAGTVSLGPLMNPPENIAGIMQSGDPNEIDRAKLKNLAARGFPSFAEPMRVRVSQGVISSQQINTPRPIYPVEARMGRIQGDVVLKVIVGKDGKVKQLGLVSGHPLLVPAAMDAVRQWQYKPYLLNGEPVELETEVTVLFRMGG